MIHELKTWPEPFHAIKDGRKRFELRKDDRPFCLGDQLALRFWDPQLGRYSGETIYADVTYILRGQYGLPDGLCLMSIRLTDEHGKPKGGTGDT